MERWYQAAPSLVEGMNITALRALRTQMGLQFAQEYLGVRAHSTGTAGGRSASYFHKETWQNCNIYATLTHISFCLCGEVLG